MVSPWWNLFQIVRLTAFSLSEVQRFTSQIGLALEANDIAEIYELTGGHPLVTASVLNAVLDGAALTEIIQDPTRSEWQIGHTIDHSIREAYEVCKDDPGELFKRLLKRESIDSRKVRESLWLAGATRDPDENSPICSELFRRISTQF